MSVLYPEENGVLGQDSILGGLETRAGNVWDQLKRKWGLGDGGAASIGNEEIEHTVMQNNRPLVVALQEQYAKHNEEFSPQKMTADKFLELVMAKDQDKLHGIKDVEGDLNDRMRISKAHEEAIYQERVSLRDGINFSSKMRGALDWQMDDGMLSGLGLEYNYKDASLRTLSDSEHQGLVEKFKTEYATQLALAANYTGSERAAYEETFRTIKAVHDAEEANGNVSRGDDFKAEVTKVLKSHSDKAAADKQRAVSDQGFNLSDPDQRQALGHAVTMMGHGDLYLDPADEGKYRQYADSVVNAFMDNNPDPKKADPSHGFRAEVKANGAAKVLQAVTMVHDAHGGENGGAVNLTPEQFHASVDAQLQLMNSGIDLANDGQRAAVAHGLSSQYQTPQNFSDVIARATLIDQAKAVKAFKDDFQPELDAVKLKGGNEQAVLDAVNRIFHNQEKDGHALITDPGVFRNVLDKELGVDGGAGVTTQPARRAELVPDVIDMNNEEQRKAFAKAIIIMRPKELGAMAAFLPTDTSEKSVASVADALKNATPEKREEIIDGFRKEFKTDIDAAGGNAAQVLVAVGKSNGRNAGEFHAAVSSELNTELAAAREPAPDQTTGAPVIPVNYTPDGKSEVPASDSRRIQAELAELGFKDNLNYTTGHGLKEFDGIVAQHTNKDIGELLGKHRARNAELTQEDIAAIDAKYLAMSHGKPVDVAAVEQKYLGGPGHSVVTDNGADKSGGERTFVATPKNSQELEAYFDKGTALEEADKKTQMDAIGSGSGTLSAAALKKLQEVVRFDQAMIDHVGQLKQETHQHPNMTADDIQKELNKLEAYRQTEWDVSKRNLSPNATPQLVAANEKQAQR